jgi:galactokinase
MRVEGGAVDGDEWVVSKPDIGEEDRFRLGAEPLSYPHGGAADFLRSAVNLVRREGTVLPPAARFAIRGDVPVQAGTSSSSALQVAWLAALLALGGNPLASDSGAIARFAYRSEVTEFDGSGGLMDQYSCALGGLVHIDPSAGGAHRQLPARVGRFVLGNSLQPKDTQAILARVQAAARRGAEWLEERLGDFDWTTTSLEQSEAHVRKEQPGDPDLRVTIGALRNRDILHQALDLLAGPNVDDLRLGELLTAHHAVLRDDLKISTDKIDRMIDAAIEAGALGGKINGSGGGGCMFAYAPHDSEAVAEAIRSVGGEAWVVEVCNGVEVSGA